MSKKVLIVDDDDLVLDNLAKALSDEGVETAVAKNGKEGLEKIEKGDFDLVVTDVRMPEMDGLELLENIRRDESTKHLPVLILTIDEQTSSINQALAAGVTAYLDKQNFDVKATAAQILTALGRH